MQVTLQQAKRLKRLESEIALLTKQLRRIERKRTEVKRRLTKRWIAMATIIRRSR